MKSMDEEDTRSLHRQAWHAIPWVVNGTASEADRAMVRSHLSTCPDCREELALQEAMHAAMKDDDGVPAQDPEPSLQRLWDRIDHEEALAGLADVPVVNGGRWTRWLVAAVVLQAVGLSALIGLQWQQRSAQPYVTLSQVPAQPAKATIRLVPDPAMRMDALRALLKGHGLRIVEVNGDGSILGLATVSTGDAPHAAETLARLRADAGVLLAEPVAAVLPLPAASTGVP
jgi:hypothetical protein